MSSVGNSYMLTVPRSLDVKGSAAVANSCVPSPHLIDRTTLSVSASCADRRRNKIIEYEDRYNDNSRAVHSSKYPKIKASFIYLNRSGAVHHEQ